jgi:hypothetical protein
VAKRGSERCLRVQKNQKGLRNLGSQNVALNAALNVVKGVKLIINNNKINKICYYYINV